MLNFVSQSSAWNPFGKFIVLFNNPDNRTNGPEKSLQTFYMMFKRFHVTDLIFAFGTGVTSYDIYTSTPYTGDHCG